LNTIFFNFSSFSFFFPLGFRIDPVEKLEETFKELKKLHDVYSTCPVFGVEFVFEKLSPTPDQLLQVRILVFIFC
jgi:Bardet-Biedl syndrome 5 protein